MITDFGDREKEKDWDGKISGNYAFRR